MKIECSIKNLLIFLVTCFVIINITFFVIIIIDKMSSYDDKILSEEEKQRNAIEFLKLNVDFNNTYEIKDNKLHFFYSNINLNNPPN